MDNIQTLILRTSQSMKELQVINKNVKVLDKKISKILFEEKRKIINKFIIKNPKKCLIQSS